MGFIKFPLVCIYLSLWHLTELHLGQRDPSQGEQTADISWWPKQSTWEGSGLDVGYWSTDNEVWFQKHLEAVRNYNGEGRAPCYSAAEWQNKLKYHRANKIVGRSRDVAVEWLSQVVIHG